jgi:hypothetical protein
VRSACSHHFCPVIGKIWIGVACPNTHGWPSGSWGVRRYRKRRWCNWPT